MWQKYILFVSPCIQIYIINNALITRPSNSYKSFFMKKISDQLPGFYFIFEDAQKNSLCLYLFLCGQKIKSRFLLPGLYNEAMDL